MMKVTVHNQDGSAYRSAQVQLPQPPIEAGPVETPTIGLMGFPGDEFVRWVHDDLNPNWGYLTRVVNKKLKMTNETIVAREWLFDGTAWKVQSNGKVSYYPEKFGPEFEEFFFHLMTSKQKDKFNSPGVGWRDGGNELNSYNILPCGGFLGRVTGYWKNYTLIQSLDIDKPLDDPSELERLGVTSLNDYFEAPHIWYKQGLTGAGQQGPYYGIVDKNGGDLYILNGCHGGIIGIENFLVQKVPGLPWKTTWINDVDVTFVQYNFSGPNTKGLAENGNWYYIERSTIPGIGNQSDTLTLVNGWPAVKPISVVGYQQEYPLVLFRNFLRKSINRAIRILSA